MNQAKLVKVLEDLGDTPDTIAAFLEGQGIRGGLGSATRCPVAVYLQRTFQSTTSVGTETAHVDCIMKMAHRGYLMVHLPPPVREFVERFDRKQYPRLILS